MPPIFILVGPEDNVRLEAIARGTAPRLDYRLVAQQCNGTVCECYHSPASLRGPKLFRVLRSMVANFRMAARLVLTAPAGSTFYSTGETWGLPVALALKLSRTRHIHIIYAHRVFSRPWLQLLHRLCPLLHVDGWVCVTESQRDSLNSVISSSCAPITVVSQGVDTEFFAPEKETGEISPPYILSVGVEMRDYPLLFDAARGLDYPVIVKASSSWVKDTRCRMRTAPPNVMIMTERLSYPGLRALYRNASLIVVPLQDTLQAAGITTILEAMAMRKLVIATRSRGLPDGLVSGQTGLVVNSTTTELKEAILAMLRPSMAREALAMAGYQFAQHIATLENHAIQVREFISAR